MHNYSALSFVIRYNQFICHLKDENIMTNNCCHLSYEERKNIANRLNDNKSINQIARVHSTILKEKDRNKV